MPDNSARQTTETTNGGPNSSQAGQITPEMVKAIADKVFNLLLLDLKYENERLRFSSHRPGGTKGGR